MKLEKIFAQPAYRILSFAFAKPDSEFYEKSVASRAGISVGSANKYMREFERMGIVTLRKSGRMKFYSLNREDERVKKLKVVFTLSGRPAEKMISAFNESRRRLQDTPVSEMWLYGSHARGEDAEDSDIDILVLSEGRPDTKLIGKIVDAGSGDGKKVSVLPLSKSEWLGMRKRDAAFYESVERDKIRLA